MTITYGIVWDLPNRLNRYLMEYKNTFFMRIAVEKINYIRYGKLFFICLKQAVCYTKSFQSGHLYVTIIGNGVLMILLRCTLKLSNQKHKRAGITNHLRWLK